MAVCAVLVSSCRTTQPPSHTRSDSVRSERPLAVVLPTQRAFCSYCSISGAVEVRTESLAAEGSFVLTLAGRDSLQGTVYGPLGILAGRAYCSQREAQLFDALAMEAYTVNLSSPKALAALPVPLRAEELFALVRGELPFADSSYQPLAPPNQSPTELLLYRADSSFVDIARIDRARGLLTAYQRKRRDNTMLFAIAYEQYTQWQSGEYPQTVRISIPPRRTELTLRIEAVSNLSEPMPFRFRIPAGVRRTVIE